jgi:hypothetical protein
MGKSPRSAAARQSRERVVFVDILKHRLLPDELEALRKKVAEGESRTATLKRSGPLLGSTRNKGEAGLLTPIALPPPVKRSKRHARTPFQNHTDLP